MLCSLILFLLSLSVYLSVPLFLLIVPSSPSPHPIPYLSTMHQCCVTSIRQLPYRFSLFLLPLTFSLRLFFCLLLFPPPYVSGYSIFFSLFLPPPSRLPPEQFPLPRPAYTPSSSPAVCPPARTRCRSTSTSSSSTLAPTTCPRETPPCQPCTSHSSGSSQWLWWCGAGCSAEMLRPTVRDDNMAMTVLTHRHAMHVHLTHTLASHSLLMLEGGDPTSGGTAFHRALLHSLCCISIPSSSPTSHLLC